MRGGNVDVDVSPSHVLLYVGLVLIGAAMGLALGLAELQSSCIAAGVLPEPGTPVGAGALNGNACWNGATSLQRLANGAGVLSVVFLIGGAVVDTYWGGDE